MTETQALPTLSKRDRVRLSIEAGLRQAGIHPDHWLWLENPGRLVLWFEGRLRTIKVNTGMSGKDLARLLGRIEGWADVRGMA